MRLGSALVAAAVREAAIQKRSVPKQIEFWAELGMAVERSGVVDAAEVFGDLEARRAVGALSGKVTSAAITYEASKSRPGFLDQVNGASGKRKTGRFRNGAFSACR